MTERKYFGTDGIRRLRRRLADHRGISCARPAAGAVLGGAGRATVLIGKDTRISGLRCSSRRWRRTGRRRRRCVRLLGPMPTPAVAHHACPWRQRRHRHQRLAQSRIRTTASSSSRPTARLDDSVEAAIEAELDARSPPCLPSGWSKAARLNDAPARFASMPQHRRAGLQPAAACA